jgi:hypothetical protein
MAAETDRFGGMFAVKSADAHLEHAEREGKLRRAIGLFASPRSASVLAGQPGAVHRVAGVGLVIYAAYGRGHSRLQQGETVITDDT